MLKNNPSYKPPCNLKSQHLRSLLKKKKYIKQHKIKIKN